MYVNITIYMLSRKQKNHSKFNFDFIFIRSLRQTPLVFARDKLLACLRQLCSLRQTRTADLYIISVAL